MTCTEHRKLVPRIGTGWRFLINLAAVVGVVLSAKEGYDAYMDRTIDLSFSTVDECRFGDLWDMRSQGALTKTVYFGEHALGLAICDAREPMEVSRPDVAAKVVELYPGCLRLDRDEQTLHMVLNSNAVCRVTKPTIRGPWYFCDGKDPSAREASDDNLVGAVDQLSWCEVSFFEAGSRPGPRFLE